MKRALARISHTPSSRDAARTRSGEARPGFSAGLYEIILSKGNPGRNEAGAGRSKSQQKGYEKCGLASVEIGKADNPTPSAIGPARGRAEPAPGRANYRGTGRDILSFSRITLEFYALRLILSRPVMMGKLPAAVSQEDNTGNGMLIISMFWCCLAGVVYTFAGYPLVLRLLNVLAGRHRPANRDLKDNEGPMISIVLIASNEEARISGRLRNLSNCRYQGAREIILVCDGCEDATADRARSCGIDIPLRLIEVPTRQGKASGLNAGVDRASGEIIVFADARQRFDEEAIIHLLAPLLHDPEVAAVSGSLEIEPSGEGAAAGIDAYWRLEKWIRHEESKWDSVIGCTGAIYAMRRCEFRAIPEDTLIDDVVVPMQALVGGKRILFAPEAKAYDPQALQTQHENRRKIRTLAGNYQMLFRYPSWLNPMRNRCWWQLISHKYLRLAGPALLLGCLVTSVLLAVESDFFRALVALQSLCYLMGAVGLLIPGTRLPFLTIPAGFLFLQWQSVRALFYYFTLRFKSSGGTWTS